MTGNDKTPASDRGEGGSVPMPTRMGIGGRLRNYFLTGVIVTAPIGITVYLVWGFVDMVDRNVAPLLPVSIQPGGVMLFSIPGLGVLVALVAVTLVGFLTANFLGRRLVRLGEQIVARMPIVRSVYSALKQIFETVLTQSSNSFRQVVLIEFPRPGCWAVAFLSNERTGEAGERLKDDVVAVYLPTALNPTSGYLLFLPRRDVIFLDMSVEEGMKLVLSGGMVIPTVPDRAKVLVPDEARIRGGKR
ncbi:MAG TPA: DUF502 domain-containing protein [Candidatus Sulfotelmatobacter sp.]|nr:DUF502 domain-containing protein [Candidatus Sulfotelmatobacter sp.]